MDLEALDYTLDPALIAQRPLAARDGGRLLVVGRDEGVRAHASVRELGAWLGAGDLLVPNDAAVVPARLRGRRATGGAVEVLVVEPAEGEGRWRCLTRNLGRAQPGERIQVGPDLECVLGERSGGPYREVQLRADGDLAAALVRYGEVPLPPYIRRPSGPEPADRARYQTVFARVPGAVAAPTAGLHFTAALLERLARQGIQHAALTLLVGPATFLPVRTGSLAAHRVPAERYVIPEATAAAIARTRAAGGRIVAVGTTSVRALESAAQSDGTVPAGSGRTDLVIAPGHRFRAVDALLTNLHLPRSSLLALVAAFAGVEATRAAYRSATAQGYRFYSYGDAMLIL